MFPPISPNAMRRVVLDAFREHYGQPLGGDELEEHVRIEDGRVVAYSYRAGSLFAMWMVQIGLVQFYDGAGNMLQTLEFLAPATKERRAA